VQFVSAIWNRDTQAFEFGEPDYNGLEYCNECSDQCSIEIVDIDENGDSADIEGASNDLIATKLFLKY
jgi:hypothetical protein